MSRLLSCFLLGLLLVGGCKDGANDGLIPVSGTVTINDSPAANVVVTYIPEGTTQGNGGTGVTDASGVYTVTTPQGKKGLPPGTYKVTASQRLNPDGSLPDPNVPPIESKANEVLPAKYSDTAKTELTQTVAADKKTFDFTLQTKKK